MVVVIVAAIGAGYYFYSSMSKPPRPFLTFATWGGIETDEFNATFAQFSQQYGVDIHIYTQAGSMDTVAKIRAEQSAPTIDLFFGGTQAGVSGSQEGLFVNLTEQLVPNLSHIPSNMRYAAYPAVVPYDLDPAGWYIRPDLIPKDFQFNGTWQWFFDPRLAGKIAIPTPDYSYFIEWASIVAGNYYNYTAGFELIKKLAPNIKVVWSSTPEIEGLVEQGNVWAVFGDYSSLSDITSKGVPIQPLKFYPLVTEPEAMMVVKGGKEALAQNLLNFILDPTNQWNICSIGGLTPTNKDSPPLPAKFEPFSASPLSIVYLSDSVYTSANADNWVTLWKQEITPLLP
jgi:putative spermidine/putrescine transport system substrate-binding protein